MLVSEVTIEHIAQYLHLDYPDLTNAEKTELETMLSVANAYIRSYTGLTAEEVDTHEDFIIVVYILVEDMYDNRVLYVENNNINKTVHTILGMHSVNLL